MTNGSPWKMAHLLDGLPGLPIKNIKKWDFPWQTVSHNQMVSSKSLKRISDNQ